MLERQLGLTKLYNYAVADAYGWTDLDLGHGFYDMRQGRRFTIEPASTSTSRRPSPMS